VILSFLLQKRRFTHKSQLLDPQALSFDVKDHLLGRDADINNLGRLLSAERFLWIIGESGVGKSALLKYGLMPQLHTGDHWLPCYVDNWGSDWTDGPLEATTDAIRKALSQKSDDTRHPLAQPGSLFTILRDIKISYGCTPLIIFDQVDDYQSRHKAFFLSDKSFIQLSELLGRL
jgi:hypothetical protein